MHKREARLDAESDEYQQRRRRAEPQFDKGEAASRRAMPDKPRHEQHAGGYLVDQVANSGRGRTLVTGGPDEEGGA